jgi:SAM-dependent MidA family methyltransferase
MSSYHSQEQTLAQLPEPSALEIKHSSELIELIVSEIERQGVISFHDYMNRVLYEPGLGYYSAGTTKFGAAGDFITAPELSPLFGRCLAQQFESIFSQGCARQLLEFGAGSGRLCEQILSSLTEATPYSIVEVSADLKARQQQYLQDKLSPTVFKNIKWLDALPENFEGIMFGNEVLDAMPVNVVLKDGQWQELGVGFEEGRFVWMPYVNRNDISSNDLAQIDAIKTIQKIEADLIKAGFGAFPEGYCTEINLNPGLQDITAFVDFDAFAGAAIDAGFTVRGLTNQRQFLLQNGLLEAAQELSEVGDTQVQIEVAQQVKTLILPGEMGDKFLVVGLQKNDLQNGLSIEIPALTSER